VDTVEFSENEFLQLPSGTEGQRPTNSVTGMIRYNSDIGAVEYFNGTVWEPISNVPISATGGTVSDVTIGGVDYRIHAFTSTGTSTFEVVSLGTTGGEVDVLVVAGGGGGGRRHGAGGGGGGVVFEQVNISAGSFNVVVGQGGQGGAGADRGGNSEFDNLTALGGGGGHSYDGTAQFNADGGSGGGGAGGDSTFQAGSALQPTSSSGGFGNDGGDGAAQDSPYNHGGGGGAGQPGQSGTSSRTGNGGDGLDFSAEFGTSFGENGYFAGGGAGGSHPPHPPTFGDGGLGGGGQPSNTTSSSQVPRRDGDPNTGGGATGSSKQFPSDNPPDADGGSGIVLIRYRI